MSYDASAGARAIAPAVPLSELPDSKDTPGRKTLPFRPAPDRLAEVADLWGRGFCLIPVHVPVPGGCSCGQPCGSPGKHPAINWEQYQAERPTQDDVHSWFRNGTRRNIGIVTGAVSGIVVVDLDSAEAESWAAANLPTTPMQVQTAKGRHLYYRHPGSPVSNKARIDAGDPAVKIDVRGDGGFVVGPGSQHASGARYERLGEWPAIDQLPMFDPAWLNMAIAPARKTMPATAGHGIPEGQRNAALATRAGQLRRIGLSQGAMAGALLVENAERCVPPLPDGEVKTIAASVGKYDPATSPPGYTFINDADILNRPAVEWLVDHLLQSRSSTGLTGDIGIGKSTVALDLACAVATGRPWLGHEADHGAPVAYIAAEGIDALAARLGAWKETHRIPRKTVIGVHVLEHAAQLLRDDDVTRLIEALTPIRPEVVVFDTMARCIVGADENSAQHIGQAIAGADRIRHELGAATVLIHHNNSRGSGPRGSTAFLGALDTLWSLVQTDDQLTLECAKQRAAAPFEPIALRLVPSEDGRATTIVLATVHDARPISSFQSKLRDTLLQSFRTAGATNQEWMAACPEVKPRTFYSARERLLDLGLVELRGVRHYAKTP